MQHPRLKLLPDKKRESFVDETDFHRFFDGALDLRSALRVDEDDVDALRRQAQATFAVRRFGDCITLLTGLIALQVFELEDLVLMGMCHGALGDDAAAQQWDAAAERFAARLDRIIANEETSP